MSTESIPKTTKAWTVEGQSGFDSLTYNESRDIPKLGDNEILVKSMKAYKEYHCHHH